MKRFTALVLALATVSLLSACNRTSVRSLDSGDGVAYYLPKRFLKVTYTRTFPATDVAKRFTKAQSALDAANKAAAELQDAFDTAEERRKQTDPASPAFAQMEKEAAYQAVLLKIGVQAKAVAQTEMKSATEALLAEQARAAAPASCATVERLEVVPSSLQPDTDKRYIAAIEHSVWRRDQIELQTTKEGLLTSSSATLTDESNGILVALASSLSAVSPSPGIKALSRFADPSDAPPDPTEKDKACRPASFEMTIDPDPTGLKMVNDALDERRSDLHLTWQPGFKGDSLARPSSPEERTNYARTCKTKKGVQTDCGLYYRRELTHLLYIVRTSNPSTVVTAVPVSLPNFSPMERISLDATAFATNAHTLTFDHGMLTKANVDQPSELLAIAKVPTNIISGVLTSVATLIQLRVNVGTQSNALVEQERLLACALDRVESARNGTEPSLPESLCN